MNRCVANEFIACMHRPVHSAMHCNNTASNCLQKYSRNRLTHITFRCKSTVLNKQ